MYNINIVPTEFLRLCNECERQGSEMLVFLHLLFTAVNSKESRGVRIEVRTAMREFLRKGWPEPSYS